MCQDEVERKQGRLMVEETEDQMGRVFLVYGTPLTALSSFWNLGQMLSSTDENWSAVEQNLQRAQEMVMAGKYIGKRGSR